jgi:hypothetical protein
LGQFLWQNKSKLKWFSEFRNHQFSFASLGRLLVTFTFDKVSTYFLRIQ